jgi:hypothetical protein
VNLRQQLGPDSQHQSTKRICHQNITHHSPDLQPSTFNLQLFHLIFSYHFNLDALFVDLPFHPSHKSNTDTFINHSRWFTQSPTLMVRKASPVTSNKTDNNTEYLAITGLNVEKIKICKKAFVLPFQRVILLTPVCQYPH